MCASENTTLDLTGFQNLSGLILGIKNKSPFAFALGDWFDLSYLSTSKASPNETGIVIAIIIVIGEVDWALHDAGII